MSKELCQECMRPKHKGSCQDNAMKQEYGETGPTPPRCSICNRDHWPFQECALRGPDEEAEYEARLIVR